MSELTEAIEVLQLMLIGAGVGFWWAEAAARTPLYSFARRRLTTRMAVITGVSAVVWGISAWFRLDEPVWLDWFIAIGLALLTAADLALMGKIGKLRDETLAPLREWLAEHPNARLRLVEGDEVREI